MKNWLILAISMLILLLAGWGYSRYRPSDKDPGTGRFPSAQAAEAKNPVIVELFTSEGCSSCPPADEVLARLERTQPVAGAEIIALGEHVDYWNYIGWADPFSAPIFGERQTAYSNVFGGRGAYTPQMVVDGQTEFIGSKMDQALDVIAEAARVPKAIVQIEATPKNHSENSVVQARITGLPPTKTGEIIDVILAVTESDLQSEVSRGENAGRHLSHGTLVRVLKIIESAKFPPAEPFVSNSSVIIERGWRPDHLRLVVFLQERRSRKIIGAGAIKLDSPAKQTS